MGDVAVVEVGGTGEPAASSDTTDGVGGGGQWAADPEREDQITSHTNHQLHR